MTRLAWAAPLYGASRFAAALGGGREAERLGSSLDAIAWSGHRRLGWLLQAVFQAGDDLGREWIDRFFDALDRGRSSPLEAAAGLAAPGQGHIHLFGLTFIFFIMGFIFSHAYLRPIWLKIAIIALPFAGVIMDVLGWYVTKVWTPFAWVVLIAGAINGLSFAAMWFISMYQMWLYKLPEHLALRHHNHDPDDSH